MENKRSIQSLKGLIILSVIVLIIGIVVGILNIGQVNEKVAELTVEEENNTEEKKVLDSDTIIAAYSPRREVASEEVVSRYARAAFFVVKPDLRREMRFSLPFSERKPSVTSAAYPPRYLNTVPCPFPRFLTL